MRDMIWTDCESYNGKGFKSEYASEELFLGPTNAKEILCDACPSRSSCAVTGAECSAFRVWCTKGTYEQEDVQRLLRTAA
jgi:hypothetical protein